MICPQSIESAQLFPLSKGGAVLEQKRPAMVRQHHAGLNINASVERPMSLIRNTPGIRPAQPTPFDHISARDDFLRGEMERGSQELLRAMIRELEAMGALV